MNKEKIKGKRKKKLLTQILETRDAQGREQAGKKQRKREREREYSSEYAGRERREE
jgi:hypothetical protein